MCLCLYTTRDVTLWCFVGCASLTMLLMHNVFHHEGPFRHSVMSWAVLTTVVLCFGSSNPPDSHCCSIQVTEYIKFQRAVVPVLGYICSDLRSSKLKKIFIKWLWFFFCILQFIIWCYVSVFFAGGLKFSNQTVEGQSQILTEFTDYVHVWLSSLLLTTHFRTIILFSSSHQLISPAALPPPTATTPSLPVCGKSHQWASGADVQVSGGDQHSYPRETGRGGEGGPARGAQRGPSLGPQPCGQVSQLRPEPVWLWQPEEQWRTECTRRETWWMNSSSPPSPSSLLSSSPLLTSPHTTRYLDISTESN